MPATHRWLVMGLVVALAIAPHPGSGLAEAASAAEIDAEVSAALQYLDRREGFELGTGPSVVVVDQGVAAGLSTSTARDDIYAFVFDQKGLMAGLGLQGSKITRIEK